MKIYYHRKLVIVYVLFLLTSFLNVGCKKDVQAPLPILTTTDITEITALSASSGGSITDDGGSTITSRGVCWSTNADPTIADSKTSDGGGAGDFTSLITNLNPTTTYYIRAYATSSAGTGYGMALAFTTLGAIPATITSPATSITTVSAILNGTVNPNYLSTTVTFEYGTTTDYGNTLTATQSPVTGISNSNVSKSITGLSTAITYHYRVKAVNALGTTYGSDMTFTTLGAVPTATTQAATNITVGAAQLKGNVSANYFSTVVTFEYGITIDYGSSVTATQSPVTGSSNTSVSASITGLSAATTYHFRLKAVNSLGTTYGSDMTFTTQGAVPTVTTLAATNITALTAQLKGTVAANYLSTTVSFEYGTTTVYGNTVNAAPNSITGSYNYAESASLTGLSAATTYHYRVKAVNALGTTYGSDMTFTTHVTDIGNNYEGGIVFFIDETGQHGLVCAPSDQSTSIQWYNGIYINIGTGTNIGTGAANTIAIIAKQGEGNYAAKLCDDLVLGGYSDWFLPSREELRLVYNNLKANGLGGFGSNSYWNSSEFSTNAAWTMYFSDGGLGQYGKYVTIYVRAVRAF